MTTTRFGVQHAPPFFNCCWWGCGLIVVCIVVAAVSFVRCFVTHACCVGVV